MFRIWILFGIWVLRFEILVSYPKKNRFFLNQLELTLTLPWSPTNTSRGMASSGMDKARDRGIGVYSCNSTTGRFRGFRF